MPNLIKLRSWVTNGYQWIEIYDRNAIIWTMEEQTNKTSNDIKKDFTTIQGALDYAKQIMDEAERTMG